MAGLQRLDLGWCACITDADAKALTALTGLTDLQLSRTLVRQTWLLGTPLLPVFGRVSGACMQMHRPCQASPSHAARCHVELVS